MTAHADVHLQAGRLSGSTGSCPHIEIAGGLLSVNGEIALGYLDLGYRPIPLIPDKKGTWVPATKWAPFQQRPPTTQEVVDWWMKYPHARIALVCGWATGLLVLDIDPRRGGADPGFSTLACSTPRSGIHYHFVAAALIPELGGPGLEWLGDSHIASVPPTPGYRWLNGGLPPRQLAYEPKQLPPSTERVSPSPESDSERPRAVS